MTIIEQPEVEIYNFSGFSLNLSQLLIDEYYIIISKSDQNVSWYSKYDECYNCKPTLKQILFKNNIAMSLSSKYLDHWIFKRGDENLCEITPDVNEFGVYELSVDLCELRTYVEPVNIGLSIIPVILIYLLVAAVIVAGVYSYNKFYKIKNDEPETNKQRVRSLDTFRGISIILMILVNYGGGGYSFLEHAVWNGLELADVVFPWFLWIMGVCIPISIKSALKREDKTITWHILKRSVILFLLGIIVNGIDYRDIYKLRIFGVLQRFGLCYIITAYVCLLFTRKDFPENPGMLHDIYLMLPQWACALINVFIHSSVTFGYEDPNCLVTGYLGPGGIQGDGNMSNYERYINCTGGAVGYVDRVILGENLMYKGGEISFIYKSMQPFDPEGIMGTFNAIFQVFLGIQAGMTLLIYKKHSARITRWLIWGVVTGLIGGGLCGFAKEDGIIPVNKNLWSLSFALITSSFAFLLLTGLYIIIDMRKIWTGKPFLFAGMNPIILYVGQALTYGRFPFQWGDLKPNNHFKLLSQAVWGTMCWWLVSYWLYRIKFFLSI